MTTTPERTEDTGLDDLLFHELELNFTIERERPNHNTHWSHNGPASWLMSEIVFPCGAGRLRAHFVCDSYKRHMETLGRFHCSGGCGKYHSMKIVHFTPID